MKWGLTILLFNCLAIVTYGQKWSVDVLIDGKAEKTILANDSISAMMLLNREIIKQHQNGHLLANIDSIVMEKREWKAYLYRGDLINQIQVNQSETISLKDKMSVNSFNNKVQQLLEGLNNEGYPFAKIQFYNTQIDKQSIITDVILNKGPLVRFDTLIIFGDIKLSKSFIKYYLGIGKGEPYNEKKVSQIKNKINSLEFIRMNVQPAVFFVKNKAQIIIRVAETKANRIDALVGFAPQSDNNNKKLLFTGQADIALNNLTGNRESFNLLWQSFLGNSQTLETKLFIPYLPVIHLGTTLGFDLTKFDSNYIQTKALFGFNWSSNNTRWTVFYHSDNTSLLNVDTTLIRNSFSFPTINSASIKAYGISMYRQNWSNNINPWKGSSFQLTASIGSKKIEKDIRIERVEFVNSQNEKFSIYDSSELAFNQYQTEAAVEYVLPVVKEKWVLYQMIEAKAKAANQIFFGDLYRLGGYKTLKGFDEQSIFASRYVKMALEMRYRINERTNVFGFFNALYFNNVAVNFAGIKEDIPYGFGFGANIGTGNNILSLAYGYGVQKNIPLNFNQGKFHFGLVSYF